MKRSLIILLAIISMTTLAVDSSFGATTERSKSIVYINGSRYYVHSIEAGDTMYSLSKLYGVDNDVIFKENPILGDGLKAGINVKIPVVDIETPKPLSTRKQKRTFDTHTIAKGETLYSISKLYQISVPVILEDNPNLDPSALALGQEINIRKTEQGLTDGEQIEDELDGYKEQLNKVAPEGYVYHLVVSGDTIYSLAKSSDMSSDEIIKINNLEADGTLRLGEIILLRDNDIDQSDADSEHTAQILFEGVDFQNLMAGERLDIALLLPLTIKGSVAKPFEEFYKGFLLGVEDLRSEGYSVTVNLYNTQRDRATVTQIITDNTYQECDLIVGPVYEDLLDIVLRDAESRKVPVVSPLATIKSSDSPVLFQMAPDAQSRYEKMDDLLGANRTVTLLYSTSTDRDYDAEVKSMLKERGISYDTHDYVYEHPSIVQERQLVADKRVEKMREGAKARGEVIEQAIIDSLLKVESKSDLTPLITNGADYNTIFVMADNEVDVDRILSALASAYTAQVAMNRGSNRDISKVLRFQVVANPEWKNYTNIDRTIYFRDRVVIQSSYLAGRDSDAIREFDSRFCEEFGEFPSLYSYRGYDIAKIFGEGLYTEMQYNMEGRRFKPLQTEYRFEQIDGAARRVNTNWMRVGYNPNFTLTIE